MATAERRWPGPAPLHWRGVTAGRRAPLWLGSFCTPGSSGRSSSPRGRQNVLLHHPCLAEGATARLGVLVPAVLGKSSLLPGCVARGGDLRLDSGLLSPSPVTRSRGVPLGHEWKRESPSLLEERTWSLLRGVGRKLCAEGQWGELERSAGL